MDRTLPGMKINFIVVQGMFAGEITQIIYAPRAIPAITLAGTRKSGVVHASTVRDSHTAFGLISGCQG